MWTVMEDAALIPMIDLDMNQTGGYLMRLQSAAGEQQIATPAAPFANASPHRLSEMTVGFNNRTQLAAIQNSQIRAPEIRDISGRSLDQSGLRSLRFSGSQWLDIDGFGGAFPTLIMMMVRFEWTISATTGAQCLLGWSGSGSVAGIYAGSATGLLQDEVLTMRFADGSFAYWKAPVAGIDGDSWHILSFYWQQERWNLRVDGLDWPLFEQGNPGRASMDDATSWRLGARYYAGAEQGLTGDLAQMLAAQHISPSDISVIEDRLMRRWPVYRAISI
jgi:hypothetical protein